MEDGSSRMALQQLGPSRILQWIKAEDCHQFVWCSSARRPQADASYGRRNFCHRGGVRGTENARANSLKHTKYRLFDVGHGSGEMLPDLSSVLERPIDDLEGFFFVHCAKVDNVRLDSNGLHNSDEFIAIRHRNYRDIL